MAVTMKDVAKHAGVGLGTVSNYLSGKYGVSKAKSQKIQASIEALGYNLNEAARCLKSSSYRTIGVLIPSFSNTYLVRVISHIEKILRSLNYAMLVVSAEGNSDTEKKLLTYLAQRTDGIIHMPTQVGAIDVEFFDAIQNQVPIVTFNENKVEFECDKVLINNGEMAYKAVKKFAQSGHEKIGILLGLEGLYTSVIRLDGYKKALAEMGIEYNEDYVRYSGFTRDDGIREVDYLISQGVTAFFICAYQLTMGGVGEVLDQGLQNDIAIVGFDAEDIETMIKPNLCYVYKSHEEIAKNVIEIIMKRVEKDYGDFPKTVVLNAELRNVENI